MDGVRKMAGETDKTDGEEEREVVHIRADEVLGDFAVICVYSPHVLCAVQV